MIDQISEIGSEQASQRISDSGQFDFTRNGLSSIAMKMNHPEMGCNNKNVSTLVENLKQEFEEIKRDWE